MEPKPGYKTTEFWMNLLAVIVVYLSSSNIAPDGSTWARVLTAIVAGLAALGYTASRSYLKSKAK